MQKSLEELRSIPEEQFQRTFRKWQERWKKCVDVKEEYFEGNEVKFDKYFVLCV